MKRRAIRWHPSDDGGGALGRNLNHDPRSWDFRVTRSAPAIRTVVHHRRVGTYDQGDIGSCVPHAGKGVLSTRPFTHRFTSERSILATYSELTAMDDVGGNYPPEDTGSDGLSFAKLAVRRGWISSYGHAMGIDDAVDALMRQPLMTGTAWKAGMDRPNPDGLILDSGEIRGAHEYEVSGYLMRGATVNYDEDLVEIVNSWGDGWGMHGRARMTVRTWGRLLEDDGDVTVLTDTWPALRHLRPKPAPVGGRH